jgi:hypothetical protein
VTPRPGLDVSEQAHSNLAYRLRVKPWNIIDGTVLINLKTQLVKKRRKLLETA